MLAATAVETLASLATALGVLLVALQLWPTRREMTAAFERTFVERYERIVAGIPLPVLFGERDSPAQREEGLRPFFDYFELCEEELYYRRARRVSRSTWLDWQEGIILNFRRPAFSAAWEQLRDRVQVQPTKGRHQRVEQFTLLRAAVDAFDDGRSFDPGHRWYIRLRARSQPRG
jgi:hypothetical protein